MATKKAVDTSALFARAREAGASWQASTNRLNEYFEVTQKQLAIYGLNLAVTVDLEIEADESGAYTWALTYERHQPRGGWVLMARIVDPDGNRLDRGAQPITNASRSIRIAAAKAIPELLQRIIDEAEAQNAEITEALQVIESVIDIRAPLPQTAPNPTLEQK